MEKNNFIVIEGIHKNPNNIDTIEENTKKIYGPFDQNKAELMAKGLIQKNVDNFYHRAWVVENNIEINKSSNALAIMSVDNLPSELPRDSSEEFGDDIVKEVLPYIIKNDDGRINDATIIKNGNFLPKYSYLKNYISN